MVQGYYTLQEAAKFLKMPVDELKQRIDSGDLITVVDVRPAEEFAAGHIKDALLIPLGQVEKRVAELEGFKNQPMIVVCGSGGRSAAAIKVLDKYGFTQLLNLKGGMGAWRKAGLPITQ